MSALRECPRCKGTGKNKFFTVSKTDAECFNCQGSGTFPELAESTLREAIINPKTKKLFSTSMNSKAGRTRAEQLKLSFRERRRAQYVWRMAIWHSGTQGSNLGGAIMADMDLGADPWRPELDKLADAVCDECYGRGANLQSAKRWHKAFYGV